MRKIRGFKRRLRQIEKWKLDNLQLNIEYLKKEQRDYVKFRIYPWTPVPDSPSPKGEVKKRILESLIEIYENWRIQLLDYGEPFYLKIWLFEPKINESQIVCAIGDKLHFYDQTFYKPELTKAFQSEKYGALSKRLNEYNWGFHFYEYEIFASDYKEENYQTKEGFLVGKKYLEKELKKPHRIVDIKWKGQPDKMFMIQTGIVWIGDKK